MAVVKSDNDKVLQDRKNDLGGICNGEERLVKNGSHEGEMEKRRRSDTRRRRGGAGEVVRSQLPRRVR